MKRSTSLLLAAAPPLACAGTALAQQAPKPENLIKWRQSAFQVVAWNSGRIKASLDGGLQQGAGAQVRRRDRGDRRTPGLGSLFPAGTETGKGWHDTTVKPELFANTRQVRASCGGDFAQGVQRAACASRRPAPTPRP